MAGLEDVDWIAQVERQLESFRRSWQTLARDIEQASTAVAAAWQPLFDAFVAARDKWRPLFEAFVAALNRADFRDLQIRLRLAGWMVQQIEAAKDNPSHRTARAWLMVQHLTPKQIAELLPYMIMDMPDLRVQSARVDHTALPQAHWKWSSSWTRVLSTPERCRPRRRGVCLPISAFMGRT